MAYDSSIFNINPYYDDYDPTKGFLRMLFKPGYALQARELTQLQTILQGQISQIGDHLFKDGSRIVGGGITVRNATYVRLSVTGTGNPLADITDYSDFVGGYLTATGFRAKVVHYIDPDPLTDSTLVLVVDLISGGSVPSSFTWSNGTTTYSGLSPVSAAYPSSGACKVITVDEGIFYIDGFFARNPRLTFTPYSTASVGSVSYRDLTFGSDYATLSKKIGFSLTRDSVTEQEDSTLRDPAIGSYNYNAPGADRYKIVFEMAQIDLTASAEDFVELLRFDGGRITKKVERVTYGEIQNVLARRTFDESGSYVVYPFDATVKPNNSAQFSLSMGSGKAYVQGYEVENRYPQTVTLPRAQTTQSETQQFVFSTGNYLTVSMGSTLDHANALVTIGSGSARVVLRDGTLTAPTTTRGTAFVHGYVPAPGQGVGAATGFTATLYLYGLSGSTGQVGFIYDNTTGNTLGRFTNGGNILGSDDQSLVFPLQPGYAINDISNGFYIQGKLVSNAITPAYNPTGTVTTYSLAKANFTDTVASTSSGVISFVNYGTGNPTNASDLSEIAIVSLDSSGTPAGGTAGRAFIPSSGTGIVLSNDGDTTGGKVKLEVNNAPAGFTAANVRVVLPVRYTPTISNTSTYRFKTPVSTTQSFASITDIKTDETGRKYFELSQSDVYSITSVTFGTPGTNISEDFELDDGQRETYYQRARLYLKPSVVSTARYVTPASAVSITVSFAYFRHDGLAFAPFIGKHSYPSTPYERIPLFTNPRTGKTVSLANCLDFRHSGLTSATPMIKPYGAYEFGVSESSTISYNHYLPRIDKLCVKADPEDGSALFFLVQGTPDLTPVAPPDPQDGLVLAILTVPAYTHNTEDVIFTPVNSQRYTMSDIGKLEKRIDDVEVFAKLSISEAEIEARSLKTSATSTEPLKTSIFSDEFYGHSVSDVSSEEHICSVDFERGELRPFFSTNTISPPSPSLSNTVLSTDGILTLAYSDADYITNLQYSKSIQVNPSNTVNWLGFLKLNTQVITSMDTGYRPVVRTNSLMENDNWRSSNAGNARGFGTQWNDWESLWTGIEVVEEEQDDIQKSLLELPRVDSISAVPTVSSGNVRAGSRRNVEAVNQKNSNFMRSRHLRNRIREKIGSRVVDRSVVGYIPSQTVTFTAYGMKPNTTGLSLYFDGTVLLNGTLSTDSNGTCSGSFTIPAGTYLTGSRSVRISDSAVVANAITSAEETLYCVGTLVQQDSGSFSTRPPTLRRRTVNSETISKDPFNKSVDSLENTAGTDPLAQTFIVDKVANPEGVFLNSLSLYFSAKDTVLPVAVDIRPTVSGYPSPSVVIPFSTVVKLPGDVTANATTPTATEFAFTSPVFLPPGEYAICITTNSSEYSLYAADTAANSITNGDAIAGRAGNNQLVGTLYTPQGSGVSVQQNTTDLMFAVKRCAFTATTGTATHTGVANIASRQAFKVFAPEVIPESCTITRAAGVLSFANNETVYPVTPFSAAPTLVYTLTRGVSNAVSPAIDTAARYAVSVNMNTQSEYLTRVVELPQSLASTGLAVFVNENIPTGTDVKVYYRTSAVGEADIFTRTWVEIPQTSPAFTSTSEIDFRESTFRTSAALAPFKSYQIKVRLTNSGGASYYRTPAVRSVRVVSFV